MKLKVVLVNINKKSLQEKKRKLINKIAREGVSIIKQEIEKRRLVNTGTLKRSVGATTSANIVKFQVGADYSGIINDGVKPHRMTYLVDAGPIPIKIKGRPTIFRVATKKNIRTGWKHPGIKPSHFFDIATNKIAKRAGEIVAESGII